MKRENIQIYRQSGDGKIALMSAVAKGHDETIGLLLGRESIGVDMIDDKDLNYVNLCC